MNNGIHLTMTFIRDDKIKRMNQNIFIEGRRNYGIEYYKQTLYYLRQDI